MKATYLNYCTYINRFIESDQPTIEDKSNDPQFKKIIASAGTGAVGALACLKYLDNVFGINSWTSAAKRIQDSIAEASTTQTGFLSTILNGIKSALSRALGWVAGLASKIVDKIQLGNKIVEGAPYTYGSVMCIALVGAAVGMILYKIYKVVMRKRKSTETREEYYTKKKRLALIAIAECNMMFSELSMLTEAPKGRHHNPPLPPPPPQPRHYRFDKKLLLSDTMPKDFNKWPKDVRRDFLRQYNSPKVTHDRARHQEHLTQQKQQKEKQTTKKNAEKQVKDTNKSVKKAAKSVKSKPTKSKPVKSKPVKSKPAKTEPTKTEPTKTEQPTNSKTQEDKPVKQNKSQTSKKEPTNNTKSTNNKPANSKPTNNTQKPAQNGGTVKAVDNTIAKSSGCLSTMWTNAKAFCGNNPILVTVIGISAASVACWYGIKKYREYKNRNAGYSFDTPSSEDLSFDSGAELE